MTHMHTDHAGGLRHFPDSEMLVSRTEIDVRIRARGRLRGYPNSHWPAWFDPTRSRCEAGPYGPFPRACG